MSVMSSTPTYSTPTYLNRQQKQEARRHLISDVYCREFGKVREKNDLPLHIKLAFFHKPVQHSLTFKLYMISILLVSYSLFIVFTLQVTHMRRCCLWLSALARRSSSSCRRLATCRSCCTRRLLWTFEARWLSTGGVKEEKPF